MSKSLARVKAALQGLDVTILETPASTRTAAEAAAVAGCQIDQIVKSILFATEGPGDSPLRLFLTAGGNQVDPIAASALAGAPLARADAGQVRAITGFAIGGVAPVGHLTPSPLWMDERLMDFPLVWAAAGTPNHIFALPPATLLTLSGAQLARFTVPA